MTPDSVIEDPKTWIENHILKIESNEEQQPYC